MACKGSGVRIPSAPPTADVPTTLGAAHGWQTQVMTGAWEEGALASAARETPERLTWYARAGLLHCDDDGRYAPDSLQRMRLIRYARLRGITDEDLALATK